MSEIPLFDVELTDKNLEEAATYVARELRPEWNLERLKFEKAKQGYVNITLEVWTDEETSDAFILRSLEIENLKLDLQLFQKIWKFTSDHALSPRLYGYLRNGICLEFVRGRCLEFGQADIVRQPGVFKLVAGKMAEYHSRSVLDSAETTGLVQPNTFLFELINHDEWDLVLEHPKVPSHYKEIIPHRKSLLLEEARIMRKLKDNSCFERAFCHMEVNFSNIILCEKEPFIYLVDLDLTGVSYSQLDLSWFFSSFVDLDGDIDFLGSYPSEEFQRSFLLEYLLRRRLLDVTGEAPDDVTIGEAEVAELVRQVRRATLVTLLRWTSAGVLLNAVKGDQLQELFFKLSVAAWRDYKSWKEQDSETRDW